MKNENGNLIFQRKPKILSDASIVGKKEGEGPLRDWFDRIIHDSYAGRDTFEQAESELLRTAVTIAIQKCDLTPDRIDIACCGDLLNQCVASSFAMRPYGIPYAGVYGACSTMALSMILASIAVESGAAHRALCAASSHYYTAERHYRFPLEYGSQRPPTSQWTVTGAGALILGGDSASQPASDESEKDITPVIQAARIGRIVDYGITDQNNMGAAMAPAVVKMGTYKNCA